MVKFSMDKLRMTFSGKSTLGEKNGQYIIERFKEKILRFLKIYFMKKKNCLKKH